MTELGAIILHTGPHAHTTEYMPTIMNLKISKLKEDSVEANKKTLHVSGNASRVQAAINMIAY